MAKFYQTKTFKGLQKEWEKRLLESGFIDHENGDQLKQNAANSYRRANALLREAKLEYFQIIIHQIYRHGYIPPDMDPLDLTVMVMRGNGLSINLVAERNKIHRQTVRFIIRRYEHQWGIRSWTLAERNLKND